MDNYSNQPTNPQFQGMPMQPIMTQPAPQPPKRRRKLLIIIGAILVVGILTLIFVPKACFTTEKYSDLVSLAQNFDGGEGLTLSDVTQNQELFTQSVYFKNMTTTVDPELSNDTTELYQKLGEYYKNNQAAAPISITLEIDYVAGNSPDAPKQQMNAVKDSLVKSGVDPASIQIKEPNAVTLDGDSLFDDDMIDGMPVGVRVTPVSRCAE